MSIYNIAMSNLTNIEIEQKHRVIPQVKFGRPNEDAEPLLSRQELKSNMFIDLVCEH